MAQIAVSNVVRIAVSTSSPALSAKAAPIVSWFILSLTAEQKRTLPAPMLSAAGVSHSSGLKSLGGELTIVPKREN